ncbi:hypothetical protein [Sphingomonas paucimobilis]|uniref:hypothetical protein n=1 Tax=Sphingomonas paucimobilis TaxID=13689 RepID=UPI00064B8AB2|nr:hypothetical protein [Sphingomonas paucimobilis]
MNSRALKELRRRQARDAAAKALRLAAYHQRVADQASDSDLVNMAIWHANKATFYRERAVIVSQPKFQAQSRADSSRARAAAPGHRNAVTETPKH